MSLGGDTHVTHTSVVKAHSWAEMGKSTLGDEQRDTFVLFALSDFFFLQVMVLSCDLLTLGYGKKREKKKCLILL